MLSRLKAEFARYFLFDSVSRARGGMVGNLLSIYGTNRNAVSEIIKDRVYLSNLPKTTPFSNSKQLKEVDKPNAALVVSPIDIPELAESQLLLEPQLPSEHHVKKIQYHLIAMQDATALVGTHDQIYDTLQIMSEYADNLKPIHIHCYSGVGRSAMMTAMHIAHRYLLGDDVIKTCIDNSAKLNPSSENFIPELYEVVSKYVFSQRNCCQFDAAGRNKLAVIVLTELHQRLQTHQPMKEARDESYQFLAAFVQTPEYKKLHHYFHNGLTQQAFYTPYVTAISSVVTQSQQVVIDPQKIIKQFFEDLLSNQENWYQQLVDAVSDEETSTNEKNPLHQLCHPSSEAAEEKQGASSSSTPTQRQLMNGILEAVNRVAANYPNAIHTQQAIAYHEKVAATQAAELARKIMI